MVITSTEMPRLDVLPFIFRTTSKLNKKKKKLYYETKINYKKE